MMMNGRLLCCSVKYAWHKVLAISHSSSKGIISGIYSGVSLDTTFIDIHARETYSTIFKVRHCLNFVSTNFICNNKLILDIPKT